MVNVFIARDGVEIGEYSRESIANLVRSGDIQPTDHYWHEGMESWALISEMLGLRAIRPYGQPIAKSMNFTSRAVDAVAKAIRSR